MAYRCSVVIPTCNRVYELEQCLDSIMNQSVLPVEIIIVDSSDNHHDTQALCGKYSNDLITYVSTTDRSSARQRNRGIDLATGDIVFLFDDDIVLESDYIERVLDVYHDKRFDNVGGAQGVDLNIKKSFLEGKKRLWFYRIFFMGRLDKSAKLLRSGASAHLDVASDKIRYATNPIRVYCFSGNLMSFRRCVFGEFEFDENYVGYSHGEDVELSHRISRKYKIYFTPFAKAYHNQPESKKSWYGTEDFIISSIRAQVYRFRKHLRGNPLNYFAILWSWLGLLIWEGVIHPNRASFLNDLNAMRGEFLKIFRSIKQ